MEEGPVVDFTFPPQNFSDEYIKKLPYPAFPDSNTKLCDDKEFFTFTMRARPSDRTGFVYTEDDLEMELKVKTEMDQENEKNNQTEKERKEIIENYNKNKKNQYLKGRFRIILK